MHELSLIDGILQAALAEAQKQGGRRITAIHASIREHGHPLEPEPLEDLLAELAHGTAAAEAEMEIKVVPLMLRCRDCGHCFAPAENTILCPSCHSSRLTEVEDDSGDVTIDSILLE